MEFVVFGECLIKRRKHENATSLFTSLTLIPLILYSSGGKKISQHGYNYCFTHVERKNYPRIGFTTAYLSSGLQEE